MATAELAVALPVLTLLLLFGVGLLGAVGVGLRCQDAARLAARAAARGEPTAVIRSVALGAAPAGARVEVVVTGRAVRVTVAADVSVPGPWSGAGPHETLRGQAVASLEPMSALPTSL